MSSCWGVVWVERKFVGSFISFTFGIRLDCPPEALWDNRAWIKSWTGRARALIKEITSRRIYTARLRNVRARRSSYNLSPKLAIARPRAIAFVLIGLHHFQVDYSWPRWRSPEGCSSTDKTYRVGVFRGTMYRVLRRIVCQYTRRANYCMYFGVFNIHLAFLLKICPEYGVHIFTDNDKN